MPREFEIFNPETGAVYIRATLPLEMDPLSLLVQTACMSVVERAADCPEPPLPVEVRVIHE